ncbi:MAG: SDR family oxidoreductase [Candidatus Diapherotrites archaeon]|nr:SDR family oxidoreductase [Candidatus Diapherotrites archaeon]
MKETVLVTGGCGFIGSHLCEALAKKGFSVRAFDNLSYGKMENLDGVEGAEFIRGDLRSMPELLDACKGADFVLHEAALRSVPLSMKNPAEFAEVNDFGTVNLLEACRKTGVSRIVFASSSSVYGNAKSFPQKESDAAWPVSPYALTKLCGEKYLKLYNDVFGIETVSLRYFNVFGPRQDTKSQYSGVIPIFAKKMLAGEQPLVHGNGKQARDFTYVSNVVEANLKAMTAGKKACGETFNVCAGKSTSLLDIVKTLNGILGTSLKPVFGPKREGDVPKTRGSPAKAKKLLGFEAKEGFSEGLKKTAEWIKSEA